MAREYIRTVCRNKTARRDYHLGEPFEAGMQLLGTEVKSLREGRANLKDSFVQIKGGEARLMNCYISPYPHAGPYNHEPERPRKLLLQKREIKRLMGKVRERGFTLVPTRIYFRGPWAKVELALAKGKSKVNKREDLKRKTIEREMERDIKRRK